MAQIKNDPFIGFHSTKSSSRKFRDSIRDRDQDKRVEMAYPKKWDLAIFFIRRN